MKKKLFFFPFLFISGLFLGIIILFYSSWDISYKEIFNPKVEKTSLKLTQKEYEIEKEKTREKFKSWILEYQWKKENAVGHIIILPDKNGKSLKEAEKIVEILEYNNVNFNVTAIQPSVFSNNLTANEIKQLFFLRLYDVVSSSKIPVVIQLKGNAGILFSEPAIASQPAAILWVEPKMSWEEAASKSNNKWYNNLLKIKVPEGFNQENPINIFLRYQGEKKFLRVGDNNYLQNKNEVSCSKEYSSCLASIYRDFAVLGGWIIPVDVNKEKKNEFN